MMVLVKPATVVQWHRQGFRLFWRCFFFGRDMWDRERNVQVAPGLDPHHQSV